MSTERLLQIKERMEKAKTEQAEIKGQITSVEQNMKKDFKVKSLSDGEIKLKTMNADLDKLEAALEKGMADLEAAHDWD